MIPHKLDEEISRWIKEKKYGNIQINFAGGKIVNINRLESLKLETIGIPCLCSEVTTIVTRVNEK